MLLQLLKSPARLIFFAPCAASFETEKIQALTDRNYRKLRLSRHNILLNKAVTPQSATAFNICDMKINPEAF